MEESVAQDLLIRAQEGYLSELELLRNSHGDYITELEMRVDLLTNVSQTQALMAAEKEAHLRELMRGQSEEYTDTAEALRLARLELEAKDATIRILDEEMRALRESSLHTTPEKKAAPPPRRPRKRVRQPQLPRRQSLRLLEKRRRLFEDTIKALAASPRYSPASPSQSEQCGGEPDLFHEYYSSPFRPDSPIGYVVSDDDEEECPQPPPPSPSSTLTVCI